MRSGFTSLLFLLILGAIPFVSAQKKPQLKDAEIKVLDVAVQRADDLARVLG